MVKLAEHTASAVGHALGHAVHEVKEDFLYKREELLLEIQYFVNKRVNKNSRIASVQRVEDFEKTASQKIKRYLYHLHHGHEKG